MGRPRKSIKDNITIEFSKYRRNDIHDHGIVNESAIRNDSRRLGDIRFGVILKRCTKQSPCRQMRHTKVLGDPSTLCAFT
jgi:hypothetical protein